MNHKRRRPKNRRAGCLICKPNKGNGVKSRTCGPRPGRNMLERRAKRTEREQREETP